MWKNNGVVWCGRHAMEQAEERMKSTSDDTTGNIIKTIQFHGRNGMKGTDSSHNDTTSRSHLPSPTDEYY